MFTLPFNSQESMPPLATFWATAVIHLPLSHPRCVPFFWVYSSQVISTGQHFLLLLSLILTSEKVCANSRSLARIARSPAISSTRKRLLGGHDITLRKIRTGNIALKFTGRICAYSKGPWRLCARGKYFPPDWGKSPSFRVCAQFSSCAN